MGEFRRSKYLILYQMVWIQGIDGTFFKDVSARIFLEEISNLAQRTRYRAWGTLCLLLLRC